MLLPRFIRAAACALGFSTALALSSRSGTDIAVRPHPNLSPREVVGLIGRELSAVSHQKRDVLFQNSSSFEKSWDGAVLLNLELGVTQEKSSNEEVQVAAGIEVTCTTCYLKASVLAELTIEGPFNVSQIFSNFTDQIGSALENATDTAVDYVKGFLREYESNLADNLSDGFDLDDFAPPPLDVDFNIKIPEIPEVQLRFQFDELELYVQLETVFSGGVTYTLNLYTSQTPFGIMVSDILFFGVIASVDLILSAESEVNITSGFHIKVDEGAELKLKLFGDVGDTDFKGGSFEFLPVTIESAGVVLKAVLRVKLRAGFEISTPEINVLGIDFADLLDLSTSAGVEVSLWTHLAELTTNVTVAPAGDEVDGCQLRVEEHYQLGFGAAAGATVVLVGHTWGPEPSTTVPLFSTSFTQCVTQNATSATVTSSATITPRQIDITSASDGLTTTTLTTEITQRGIECMSSQLIDCPVSLQRTTKTSMEITLVTAVPSGVEATFPASIQTTNIQTIPFGSAVNRLFETATPSPTYVPEENKSKGGFLDGEIGGVDKRIIFGVAVGGGILILSAIIGGIIFWYKRRQRYSSVPPPPHGQNTTYHVQPYKANLYDPGKGVYTTTTEIRRN